MFHCYNTESQSSDSTSASYLVQLPFLGHSIHKASTSIDGLAKYAKLAKQSTGEQCTSTYLNESSSAGIPHRKGTATLMISFSCMPLILCSLTNICPPRLSTISSTCSESVLMHLQNPSTLTLRLGSTVFLACIPNVAPMHRPCSSTEGSVSISFFGRSTCFLLLEPRVNSPSEVKKCMSCDTPVRMCPSSIRLFTGKSICLPLLYYRTSGYLRHWL